MLIEQPLLLWMIVAPFIGALALVVPVKELDDRRIIWKAALFTSLVTMAISLTLLFNFDWAQPTAQMRAELPWLPSLGLTFSLAIDGISIWLVLLTTVLMPIVFLAALPQVNERFREFYFWLLILEGALLGTFLARDLFLFYLCFEFTLIPLFFLIGIFGHTQKLRAAKTFFLYTFTGSLLTLVGVLYVAYHHFAVTGAWTMSIDALYETAHMMTFFEQSMVLLAFLAGFGVKVPMWPVHTWLPLAHTEAPTAGSVDLAGLVLKLGPYGLLRFAIPMCPDAVVAFAPYIAGFGIAGIIFAGLVCWVQKDAKKLIAYSSVSHMGFCVLGLFAFDAQNIGAAGSVYYMISHGLSSGALFLCVGMLYDRFHTRNVDQMSGLGRVMPVWGFFMIFFCMASVGLPGLNGFIGEFLTMLGTFLSREGVLGPAFALFAASGVVIAAIYLLYIAGRLVFGPLKTPALHGYEEDEDHHVKDLSYREILTLAPLAALCLIFGIFPNIVLNSLDQPIAELNQLAHESITERQVLAGIEPDGPETLLVDAEQSDAMKQADLQAGLSVELMPQTMIALTADAFNQQYAELSDEINATETSATESKEVN